MSIKHSFPAYDAIGKEYEVLGYMLGLVEGIAGRSIRVKDVQGYLDHMVELGYLTETEEQ